MRIARLLLVLSLLMAVPLGLRGQTVQGVVTGTVFDKTGGVVPGATVTLTSEGTNVSQLQVTATDGSYRFSLVPPGTYTVTVTAPSFAEKVNRGIIVRSSQTVPHTMTVEMTSDATTLEVTGASPLVQNASSDLTSSVDRNTIESTALLSRNVYDLAFLAPQVSLGMDLKPTSGGARQSGTAYLLNGAENNDNFSEGGINVVPALESVGEFTMLTNSMSAQYGRAAGAIVSTSQRSGGNKLHGVVYEFNRNRSLNASDFFQNRQGSAKPKYIRNQFGGEIDGPVFKHKTFFSFGIDKVTLERGGELSVQAPTPAEIAAMSAGAGPIAKAYMSKYPTLTPTQNCPNQERDSPTSIGHIGCLNLFDPISEPAMTWFGRIDHNFSVKDRLSFTLNVPRSQYIEKYGGGHPSTTPIPYIEKYHFHNLALAETHMLSPRVLNEFTVAHNRHFDVTTEGDGSIRDPELSIDGSAYGGLGFGYGAYEGNLIAGFVQDRWQYQDNLGWSVGKHSFKFGFGWMWGNFYRNWDLGLPGHYSFANTTGPTPESYGVKAGDGSLSDPNGSIDQEDTNFQHDFPYSQELAIDPRSGAQASAYRHYVMNDVNGFVNDDWKVSRRLTLNLGLRWERFEAPREVNGILAQFTNLNCLTKECVGSARIGPADRMWRTRNHDFAPRFGFAWDIFGNGRTALRGGYGISYDRIFDNVWSNGAWNPPFYGLIGWDLTAGDTLFFTNPPRPSPSYVPNSLPGPAGRVSIRTMENDLKDSSVHNFYFGVQREFFRDFVVSANYQGSLGRHLPVLMNLNRYDGMRYNPTFADARPNPLYTGFNYRANNINSSYNGLVVEVQKRLSGGLRFQTGYTFAKLIDYGSDLFSGETTQGAYSQPYYFISNAHKEFEKGRGAFDHTHSYKLNISYELPVFRTQHGFVGKALGGWQLSGFYQFYPGHPIEVFMARTRVRGNAKDANGVPENLGGDYNLDGVGHDRPVFVGNLSSAYATNKSPADGIFADNNQVGCGFPGAQSTNIAACNKTYGVATPNTLFVNPPGTGVRFGSIGRNVFTGPSFHNLDAALIKDVKISEGHHLQFRFEALNLPNHANFDGVNGDLRSSDFGKAQILVGQAHARIMQVGIRYSF